MSFLEQALKYAQENKDRHLAEYRELVGMASISTLPEHKADVERTAQWLAFSLLKLQRTSEATPN